MQTMMAIEVGTLSLVRVRYWLESGKVWEMLGSEGVQFSEGVLRDENMMGSKFHWGP